MIRRRVSLQVDFGRLGLVCDGERRRFVLGVDLPACCSCHQFVWPTFWQTTEDVIAGFEAAWVIDIPNLSPNFARSGLFVSRTDPGPSLS